MDWNIQWNQKELSQAPEIIIDQDREGDLYEQFASIPKDKTDLLYFIKAKEVDTK